jgi:hypothetical protein
MAKAAPCSLNLDIAILLHAWRHVRLLYRFAFQFFVTLDLVPDVLG